MSIIVWRSCAGYPSRCFWRCCSLCWPQCAARKVDFCFTSALFPISRHFLPPPNGESARPKSQHAKR
jgi:hypothetical protein